MDTILSGILHRLAALDLVDVIHALDDLAPDRVLAVEEAGIVEADEELRVGGVRVLGARHRAGAAAVVHVGELGLQVRLVGAAHAGAGRVEVRAVGLAELDVAGLGHEAVDDAVEHDAVIGAFARQFLDAADMAGSEIREEFDDDPALRGLHDERVFAILDFGHVQISFSDAVLLAVAGDAHLDHAIGLADNPVGGGITLFYLVHELHAALDIADDGVVAVEARVRRVHDEELGIG